MNLYTVTYDFHAECTYDIAAPDLESAKKIAEDYVDTAQHWLNSESFEHTNSDVVLMDEVPSEADIAGAIKAGDYK